MVKKLKYTNTP